jgi:hypothetical protein
MTKNVRIEHREIDGWMVGYINIYIYSQFFFEYIYNVYIYITYTYMYHIYILKQCMDKETPSSPIPKHQGLSAQDLRQPLLGDALLHGGRGGYLREQLQLRGGGAKKGGELGKTEVGLWIYGLNELTVPQFKNICSEGAKPLIILS